MSLTRSERFKLDFSSSFAGSMLKVNYDLLGRGRHECGINIQLDDCSSSIVDEANSKSK